MEEIDRARLAKDNRQISIQMELLANRYTAPEGLTVAQAHLLRYILLHSQGISLTDIRPEFGCSMATLSCMVKRLREKGYVRTESCAADDRRKLLFATRKGQQAQSRLDAALTAAQQQLYGCFSSEELAALDCLQQKMLQNLSSLMKHIDKEVSQP